MSGMKKSNLKRVLNTLVFVSLLVASLNNALATDNGTNKNIRNYPGVEWSENPVAYPGVEWGVNPIAYPGVEWKPSPMLMRKYPGVEWREVMLKMKRHSLVPVSSMLKAPEGVMQKQVSKIVIIATAKSKGVIQVCSKTSKACSAKKVAKGDNKVLSFSFYGNNELGDIMLKSNTSITIKGAGIKF